MGLQSRKSPNFKNFGTPNLGVLALNLRVPEQNDIWVQASWPSTENTIKGEGGGFPQVWAVVNLMSLCLLVVCSCAKNALTMH
jgi:hypothetical protein